MLAPLLPAAKPRGRPRSVDLRRIVNGIFSVLHTGCAWQYLPCNLPPWPTVFYHFRRCRLKGIWSLLLRALHAVERKRV